MNMDNKNIGQIYTQLLTEKYTEQWEEVLDETKENPPLPTDGVYKGKQSGYRLTIEGNIYNVKGGIRGLNFPYNIEIKNGKILKSYV